MCIRDRDKTVQAVHRKIADEMERDFARWEEDFEEGKDVYKRQGRGLGGA